MNHIVGGAKWFALCVETGAAPEPDTTLGADYAGGNVLASYDEGVKATIAAFDAAGAQEKLVKLPFGEMPGAAFMGVATNDVFAHGWDLAKATGQPTDLDPEMATQLLAQAQAFFGPAVRGPEGSGAPFGDAKDAPASGSAADKLATSSWP